MTMDVVIGLIVATTVVTVSVLLVVRRMAARASINRVIARFERDFAAPVQFPVPSDRSRDERSADRNDRP
jgi:hypothetical protein